MDFAEPVHLSLLVDSFIETSSTTARATDFEFATISN